MKKTLLLMAAVLLTSLAGRAQDEDATTPVHKKALLSVIEDAKTIVADSHYTTGQADLQSAIEGAEAEADELPDDEEVRTAIVTLQMAIDEFITANTAAGLIADATSKVENPSFDQNGSNSTTINGWVVQNFKNNRRGVSYESTSTTSMTNFAEQWVNGTALAGSGDLHQTLSGLPAGHYRLTADVFAINQKTADIEDAEGVEIYVNDQVRQIGLSGTLKDERAVNYGVDVDIAAGEELTIGLRFASTNVNWVGWDNVTLLFVGDASWFNNQLDAEKITAAKATLTSSIDAAKALLDEAHPLHQQELNEAIAAATVALDAESLEEVEQATQKLAEEVGYFNYYNNYYVNLAAAIEAAQARLADESLTTGRDAFAAAIAAAETALQEGKNYSDDEAIYYFEDAQKALEVAQSQFLVANANYYNPANVILNGGMSSTDGWDILLPGANPGLHINTNGTVENFSRPFMECWVNNVDYGRENYARQTVTELPDGTPLPAGYYVLKAACLATRQNQANLEVSGVTLRIGEQSVDVHTANGVANIYTLGYDQTTAGAPITFGLYIDASTNANWIAWDEVELQYVGDKEAYLAEYAKVQLGEHISNLQAEVDKVQQMLTTVDTESADMDDINGAIEEAQYWLDNPLEATIENLDEALEYLRQAEADFYLSGAKPIDGNTFDFTSLIQNPNFDNDASGWDTMDGSMVLPDGADCPYWYFGGNSGLELTQEIQQTLSDMPAGNYLLDVNAAIRLDMTYSTNSYTEARKPNYVTRCQVYANEDSTDVHPFFYEDEARGITLDGMLAMTNDNDYRHGNGTLIDYMLKQSGLFHVYVPFTLEERGDITIGFLVELPRLVGQMPFIDSFALSYYGDQVIETGVAAPEAAANTTTRSAGIYNLQGQLVRRENSIAGLPRGLYIVDGRKVIVK